MAAHVQDVIAPRLTLAPASPSGTREQDDTKMRNKAHCISGPELNCLCLQQIFAIINLIV